MGLLTRINHQPLQAATPGPLNDFWYEATMKSSSGMIVSPEAALAISAVYACVRILAETVAQLPALIQKRMEDGGKERAPEHEMYPLIHDQPNRWQTAFEFWEMLMAHLALRGNAYAYIYREMGTIKALIPMHPSRMSVEQLPNLKLRYKYRESDGSATSYVQEEVFHLRGLSSNGITGISVVSLAKDSFGLSLATESFGNRSFTQGARPSGILTTDKKLGKEAADRMATDWQETYGSIEGKQKVAVLEDGLKWMSVAMTSEDAQFLETRKFQITEIARWFRIPPHLLGDLDRATFSNIEQQSLEFVIYTMMPWLRRLEQGILRDLIDEKETYFAEFLVDGLVRGDIKTRYEAYASGINAGWLVPNEAREMENRNKLEGLDEPRQPLNTAVVGEQPAAKPVGARARLIAFEAAARIIRKEIVAISKNAKKLADNAEAWEAWLKEFYTEHAEDVSKSLRMDPKSAQQYCAEQCRDVLTRGVAVLETWEADRTPELARLALADDEPAEIPASVPLVVPAPPVLSIVRVKKTVERDSAGRIAEVVEETSTL